MLMIEKSKEKQYQIEIEHLRENLKQTTLQFESQFFSFM